MKKKAVILLSGGLDSAVTLYAAQEEGYECLCLTFDYGQRHRSELAMAGKIAGSAGAELKTVRISLPWGGSSLLDGKLRLPSGRTAEEIAGSGVPSTYVPARNTIFLSMAVSYAEAVKAEAVFIGAHSEDSSGYPDCTKEYLEAFGRVVEKGTKLGMQGRLKLKYPLIEMSKKEIIEKGRSLGVPFEYTRSCYESEEEPCGRCDSCVLRSRGFERSGIPDPALKGIPCRT